MTARQVVPLTEGEREIGRCEVGFDETEGAFTCRVLDLSADVDTPLARSLVESSVLSALTFACETPPPDDWTTGRSTTSTSPGSCSSPPPTPSCEC